jgi:hypothetical protein
VKHLARGFGRELCGGNEVRESTRHRGHDHGKQDEKGGA